MNASHQMPQTPPEEPSPLMARLTAALASLIALFLGGSGAAYFLSPAFSRKEEDWVDLGRADAFKPGDPAKVEFVERRKDAWVTQERRSAAWVVVADGSKLTVFDPRCTHLGCPYRWDAKDKRFVCPCHTAAFGMTGHVLSGPPPRPLDRYPVQVTEGRLLILPEPGKEKS